MQVKIEQRLMDFLEGVGIRNARTDLYVEVSNLAEEFCEYFNEKEGEKDELEDQLDSARFAFDGLKDNVLDQLSELKNKIESMQRDLETTYLD